MQPTDLVLSDRELDEIFAHDSHHYNVRIDMAPLDDQDDDDNDSAVDSPRSSTPSSPVYSSSSPGKPLADGVSPERCGYRTGKCTNLQAVKRNGKLHKLCEFHRDKANQNQKKLDRKKRLMRYTPYDGHLSSDDESSSYDASPRAIDNHHHHHYHHQQQHQRHQLHQVQQLHPSHFDLYAPHPTSLYEAPLALAGEELEIFYSLMTFDIHHRSHPAYTRPHNPSPMYHQHHHHNHRTSFATIV